VQELAFAIFHRLIGQPNSASAGYWFEYLVAAVISLRHGKGRLTVSKDVVNYMSNIKQDEPKVSVLMPDNYLGPDVV
jgi:hypothetical protein